MFDFILFILIFFNFFFFEIFCLTHLLICQYIIHISILNFLFFVYFFKLQVHPWFDNIWTGLIDEKVTV